MRREEDQSRHSQFVRLLSAHSRPVFGFILGLASNRSDAEDISQDASVAMWKKFGDYREGTNFRAWACQVAYFEIVEHRRRKSKLRRLLSDEAFQALATEAFDTSDDTDRREDLLAGCLEKLPAADRRLIESRYFSAQSAKQIAEKKSKSIHSVYRSLSRIHDTLMRCVQHNLNGEAETQ